MHEPHALKLYVDGSAFRNPGHEGGFAVIAEYPDSLNLTSKVVASGSFDETTNNRMELRASIEAFRFGRVEADRLDLRHIVLITDSQYVYNNQTRASYWKKNDWKNNEGRPVENKDLWNEFLSTRSKIRASVDVRWESGKTTDILKSVDKNAKKAVGGVRRKDFGYVKGKISRTKIRGGGINMFPANNQNGTVRIFSYSQKSNEELKVCFELCSAIGTIPPGKYFAYVKGKNTQGVHRYTFYTVKFGTNPKYPIIEKLKPVVVK